MEENIIELSGLTKIYGTQKAVDHLNLNIKKGEIFGLLGPNGAGKSTTIRMMLGLTAPSSGMVKVCGVTSTFKPIDVKRRVGYLPEDVGFYDNMTGFENLMFTARLNQIPVNEAKSRALQLLDKVGLSKDQMRKTGVYSRGMRQRLGLADTLIKKPEVIILDEPTLGIDPKGVKDFLEMIVDLSRKEKITVLFSSHHLHQVQQVCDRVGIFVKGQLIAEGDLQALSKKLFSSSPYVIEAKLAFSQRSGSKHENGKGNKELIKSLKHIQGVNNVEMEGDTCLIDSDNDVSAQIANTIIEHNCSLFALQRKEYGLDDIYYKYFEGADNHE
jgi:ABC-2 type transport system ATP-binding protein